ncbi:spindle pole body component 110-like [Actinia tenebrosa]|uniref:Spindle pole body component 110-like n=1 Tax=Actinia tenebrosa TaxID=6105 RepID=A0A6P8I6A5_ACTTE|nr:spindle pole body component 110-like [Actinia tenebrosa]
MSRLRTDLRASLPPRRGSSTKFPPVRVGSRSPCSSPQNWATDMVVGLQLRTASPPKETRARSTVVSPKERIKDIINSSISPKKTAPSNGISQQQLEKLNQQILSFQAQEQQYLDKIAKLEKEIEKLKSKNTLQQKAAEQLKAELKEKNKTLTELEEQLQKQEAIHQSHIEDMNSKLYDKDQKIKDLEKQLADKTNEVEQMKEKFAKEKDSMKKEFDEKVEEMKNSFQNELKIKDDKLKTLKLQMADALKDNSRERQHQLEELTRELKKVSEEADILKYKIHSSKPQQGGCKNCLTFEKELQNKIIEIRNKDLGLIELQQLCGKMEKQLMQQDELLRLWAKSKGKVVK